MTAASDGPRGPTSPGSGASFSFTTSAILPRWGRLEITRFLSWLAVDGKVAASTQTQALSALLFLYHEVLDVEVPWLDDVVRAKRPQRLPVVLTRDEVSAVLQRLEGVPRLMAYLLYGSGLRVLECCRLRVQDIDFARNEIVVRSGKGDKDRMTMLPASVKAALVSHLAGVREQHRADLAGGAGWVESPTVLVRKYPNAGTSLPGHSDRHGSQNDKPGEKKLGGVEVREPSDPGYTAPCRSAPTQKHGSAYLRAGA